MCIRDSPTKEQREHSDLSLTLAASEEKIVMIEAGANEVDEETMMKACLLYTSRCV